MRDSHIESFRLRQSRCPAGSIITSQFFTSAISYRSLSQLPRNISFSSFLVWWPAGEKTRYQAMSMRNVGNRRSTNRSRYPRVPRFPPRVIGCRCKAHFPSRQACHRKSRLLPSAASGVLRNSWGRRNEGQLSPSTENLLACLCDSEIACFCLTCYAATSQMTPEPPGDV